MDARQGKFPQGMLATRAVWGAPLIRPDGRCLSLSWLSTLIFASLASIFALGWAFVGRDAAHIERPRFVMNWGHHATPGSQALVLAAAGSNAGMDVAASGASVAGAEALPQPASAAPFSAAPLRAQFATVPASDAPDQTPEGSPFVHARLSLFASEEPLRDTFALSPERDVANERVPLPVAMGLVSRPDIDDRVMLTALAFPLADAKARQRAPASLFDVVKPPSEPLATDDMGDDNALDPARFGGLAEALGFAPVRRRRETPQFASFELGSTSPSWRRLADGNAGEARAMTPARSWDTAAEETAELRRTSSFLAASLEAGASEALAELSPGGPPSEGRVSVDGAGQPIEPEEVFFDRAREPIARATVYDAVERSARSYGLSPDMTARILKLLSAEYDFDRSVEQSDRLDVYFSQAGENDAVTEASEFYFVRATFGGTYRAFYRFETDDGTVAYFGPEGRSSGQFLLRNPVPSGRFQSGFGMRRHPILGYDRMHNGIDWSAPKGTPIFATASGTVERAGVNGGFGLQTVIRHDDGYTTSYGHQSALADTVAEGDRVLQGEVIGFVGSTGLATGAHIHYEVAKDGVEIDPMHLKASGGPLLSGERLDAFLAERDRIDALVYSGEDAILSLAAVRD
ncbi:MAG: M23 family metallopeptidase [Rhizobiaceae bacterium]|nr:M23 family metallopeptidase [Rhizobiaceae bacterium]